MVAATTFSNVSSISVVRRSGTLWVVHLLMVTVPHSCGSEELTAY